MSMAAHWWTLAPKLQRVLQPSTPPPSQPWGLELANAGPSGETVHLTGRFHPSDAASTALVTIHGLGGCTESEYMVRMARLASEAGFACLRLNLRGSDRQGNDFYHAGLTSDLHAALKSPLLAGFDTLALVGFSMGGHVALKAATEDLDPRVTAVAAVCSPLDLAPCAVSFDRPNRWLYRRYVMASLLDIYRAVAERRPVPLPVEEAAKLTRIRDWDEKIVAPRWGFEGSDDYYARASVGPLLPSLKVPALLVQAAADPMVPDAAVRPALDAASGVTAHWVARAGHVGFPRDVDLGMDAPLGLEPQLLRWIQDA